MSNEAMDYLRDNSGSSYPAFKFPTIGSTAKGKIVSTPKVVTTSDMNTGEPRKSLVIELEQDDGEINTLWVKPGSMATAIRNAITVAEVDGLAEGGTLAVKYVADGEQRKPGWSPPHLFEAAYAKPAPKTPVSNDVNDLLNS